MRTSLPVRVACWLCVALLAGAMGGRTQPSHGRARPTDSEWPVYGGNAAGQRYTRLEQINRGNVGRLVEAWRFNAGVGQLQTSPIMIGTILYGYMADQSVIALDAATGQELWRFASGEVSFQPARGLAYWTDGREQRLFASSSFYLYALDPRTGQPVPSFGDGGRIDLRQGMGRDPDTLGVFLTSPGIVYKDLLITGFRTGEAPPAAPGRIRAFDVRSGQLRWTFNAIPEEGEPGSESWPRGAWQEAGGANNWAGMALDEQRGIVYVPTGSAVADFYGGNRLGDNLYADSLIALDAGTGRRLWHFQGVHHDLWDRDFPSPPSLLNVTRNGHRIDAIAQPTKQGVLFVFDRVTGKPLFPIGERRVPQTDVPGEHTSPTQPFPALPVPFARQALTEAMLTNRTPEAHAAVLARFRQVRSAGPYAPLTLNQKTVVFPGFDGGAEWGGAAVDPKRGILYINANDVPSLGSLAENRIDPKATHAELLYKEQCSACHRITRQGTPPDMPSLIDLGKRMSRQQAQAMIAGGKGRMPGFPQIGPADRAALVDYLFGADDRVNAARRYFPPNAPAAMIREAMTLGGGAQSRYLFTGYEKFQDPDGYPAVVPPWGTLSAIDLNSGQYLWKIPLGEYPELAARGMRRTGSENYGGPLVTASKLLFIGATVYDRKFRAFDADNGRLLWETTLPYAGTATPISYAVKGRQYVVIATSGGRNPKGPQGSAYMAYTLPQLSDLRHR